ncbi:hypothetical protein V1525DRAFT_399815 [Lipomyces kononenkoae]|uniref:Uncharacterized protein n=1 Tax=Lipomyces kononenkoae TaxID=34357 RepID=A0ACC3T4Q9_LIPKO
MVTPNFTGNYRHGRQVNLARSSASSHRSSQSILKDASAARAQREELRKRERSAIVIQSFYRGRRDVAQARERLREEFIRLAGQQSVAMSPGDVAAMFVFFFGKGNSGATHQDVSLIPMLERMIGGSSGLADVDSSRARKLARVLLGCLRNVETNHEIQISCLRLLRIIQAKVSLEEVIASYSSLISGLRDASALAKVVENVIIATKSTPDRARALLDYVKYFLSTPNLFVNITEVGVQMHIQEVFNFSADIIPLIANPAIQSSTTATLYEPEADQDSRLEWLLANILYMWRHQRMPEGPIITIPFMRALSNILRGLSVSAGKRLSRALSTSSGGVDQFVRDNLEVLKERQNIELSILPVTSMLSSNGTGPNREALLATCLYFVSLLRIWPLKNSEIRYFLYLTPEYTLPLFFKTLKASRLFDIIMFKSFGPTAVSSGATASLWAPAVDDEYHDIAIQEWEILSLFLDICWHWMIMTDDDEFFDETQYGLSLSDVRELGMFLKVLVFLIVCNDDATVIIHRGRQIKIGAGGDNHVALSNSSALTLNKIKTNAIGIMRQLVYRDSRRSFLNKKYWLMDDRIDIPAFTAQAIIDEDRMDRYFEQNMLEISDDTSESEFEVPETGFSSSSARLDLRAKMMVTPRIEILQKIPFILPFQSRVEIFDRSLDHDRAKHGLDRDYELRWRRHKAEIRRSHMLEDAFNQLNGLRSELKSLIGITFVNDFGVEAGIDGGGITKEFLVGVCKEGFDPANGLFLENSQNLLYPNPAATSPEQLQYFEFLGRVIGKALYQGILVEVSFAQFFLSKWQVQNNTVFGTGFRNTFDDLWSLDPELYRGLIKLKNYSGDVESDFGLNFTITNSHNITVELIRNGAHVAVTAANRLQYIHEVANYKLNKELYRQTQAFLFGMNDLLSPTWLVMFSPNEMQTLVGGAALPIDIEDWKKNTVYGGFYEKDPTITYFWEVIEELNDEDVRSVLKFVTSVSRAPLQGFSSLKPSFTIRESGLAQDRLPTASTCVNMLKLPRYVTKETLKSKLMFAVTAGAGFDLS